MKPEPEPDFNGMLAEIEALDGATFPLRSRTGRFMELPVEEYRQRYARAARLMELHGLDALLVTQDLNVRYFTGWLTVVWASRFRPLVAVLPRDPEIEAAVMMPGFEIGNVRQTSWVPDIRPFAGQSDPIPTIVNALRDRGLVRGRVGMELGFGQRLGMSINQYEHLRNEMAPLELVNATPIIQAVRMLKSEREIARLRRACAISQEGVRQGWEEVRPGMTEKELASIIMRTMSAAGAEVGAQPSFIAIFAGPERYRMICAHPSDHCLEIGDLIVTDGGAVFEGYATDMIRQACLGEPTAEQRRYFDIAVEANDAAVEAARPGNAAADVYEAAVSVFRRHNVVEYNLMNFAGHGIGMEIHELPWLGERNTVYTAETILRPGMALCIEPALGGMHGDDWATGWFIVEDMIAITKSAPEILTRSLSKNLQVIACSPAGQ